MLPFRGEDERRPRDYGGQSETLRIFQKGESGIILRACVSSMSHERR
jgi:hypothetical protein